MAKVGRPPNPFGRTTLARLYPITERVAQGNRDALTRLGKMLPEARRYTLKVILESNRRSA